MGTTTNRQKTTIGEDLNAIIERLIKIETKLVIIEASIAERAINQTRRLDNFVTSIGNMHHATGTIDANVVNIMKTISIIVDKINDVELAAANKQAATEKAEQVATKLAKVLEEIKAECGA